jgi:hypothetical protein
VTRARSSTPSHRAVAQANAAQTVRASKGGAHLGNELASAAWGVAAETVEELRRKRGRK